mgnify:FL=1
MIKRLFMKIFTVILGILILCLVFKYFFHYDLWNLFMLPLFRSIWNFVYSLFN